MKVPFPANSHQNNSKPLIYCTTTTPTAAAATFPATTTTTTISPYEPKSVLDLSDDPFHPEAYDHVLMINQQLVDWDSLMRELGPHDNSNPLPKPTQLSSNSDTQITTTQYSVLPELPPVDSNQFVPSDFTLLSDNPTYSVNNSFDGLISGGGFDYVGELIRLAECFETNSFQLGNVILGRLNQTLTSPIGKPLQRAAFYFKESLQSRLTESTRPGHNPPNSSEIIQTIKAEKAFSSISPIPLFSSFTANQAVLEAVEGSTNVHVIDFDIGLGGHWASFMKELARDKAGSAPPMLRISAIVFEEKAVESKLIRENLTQFAKEMNIRFDIEFVLIRTFEYLSFKAIKFMDGETVAVLLSSAIFRRVGTGFLEDLRRVSPHVVVHVDSEGGMDYSGGTASYRQVVIDGLEFYSTLLESLEAAAANFDGCGDGGDWIKEIETFVVFPKIVEGVKAAAGRRGRWWREAMVAAGLREVGLSRFVEFQAECLLRRIQVRGFQVAKRQAEMLLCWHDRPTVATSAWWF